MTRNKRESFADFLLCASVLEERTYTLYRNLAGKVDLPLVNSMLLHIAYDSQKHSAIFSGMANSIAKSKVKPRDCEKRLGDTWRAIENVLREISKRKNTWKESTVTLLEKLTLLESSMGEEYHILVQAKTLQYMTKQIRETYDVDLEDLKEVFEIIIKDEEMHRELLSKIRRILATDQQKTEETPPLVKYTNPDAWSKATPSSVYESAL